MVSQYNIKDPNERYGIKNLGNVVGKRLKMQGFIVGDPDMVRIAILFHKIDFHISSRTIFEVREATALAL